MTRNFTEHEITKITYQEEETWISRMDTAYQEILTEVLKWLADPLLNLEARSSFREVQQVNETVNHVYDALIRFEKLIIDIQEFSTSSTSSTSISDFKRKNSWEKEVIDHHQKNLAIFLND